MQVLSRRNLIILMSFLGCGLLIGCPAPQGNQITPVDVRKPFEGRSLTVVCANPEISTVLQYLSKNWMAKSGAKVTFLESGSGDLFILPMSKFGDACAKNAAFQKLNIALRSPTHPFQANGQCDAYFEGLAGWQGQPMGTVVSTEAAVLVYRADRFSDRPSMASFRTQRSRDLAPPTNWDEYAEIAKFFSEIDGKPRLPHFASSPSRLLDLFHRIAASTDRPALTQSNMHGRGDKNKPANDINAEAFSFHFDFATGKPRLSSQGFALAIESMIKIHDQSMTKGSGDPIVDLEENNAIMAIVTMADLARLKKTADGAVPEKFAITKLPGSKRYYDGLTKQIETINSNEPNTVPYLGGGYVCGVTIDCQSPEAAFDLLGEFGSPSGASALCTKTTIGSAPWRSVLLDANKKNVWYGYGFNAEQTQNLMTALRPYLASDLRNPVVAPRGPGMDQLMEILATHVLKGVTKQQSPADAMAAAQNAWQAYEATLGDAATVTGWRRSDMRAKP